ncbi:MULTISPECIES: GtrA family protein [Hyphobacterium]|uniref:GtrA family protein n=1 Tax=Hyphobacterium vulgare TaxID=1736751 RepID=A0ABV6ZVG6_9PROT
MFATAGLARAAIVKNLSTRGDKSLPNNRGIRFILVGFTNTLLTLCIYSAAVVYGLKAPLAVIISALCGITFSAIMNSFYTFRRRSGLHIAAFFAVYFITVYINIVVLEYIIKTFVLNSIIAQAILVLPIAVITFGLLRISDSILAVWVTR